MKMLTTVTLRGSQKRLRAGPIRSPAALPRMAVRGRAFLSEQPEDNRSRYYKGGQSEACPPFHFAAGTSLRSFAHPTVSELRKIDRFGAIKRGRHLRHR